MPTNAQKLKGLGIICVVDDSFSCLYEKFIYNFIDYLCALQHFHNKTNKPTPTQ